MAKAKNGYQYDEGQMLDLIKLRFAAPAYAFIPSVRNSTGFSGRPRTADAIAMMTWPSRGLLLHGFEVKVERGDWLRELKNPEKAEEFFQFCDRWWVAACEGVVDIAELPPKWGLLTPAKSGKSLQVRVEADALAPKPPDRILLASLFRRAMEIATDSVELKRIRECSKQQGYTDGQRDAKEEYERALNGDERTWNYAYKRLRREADEFKNLSGIGIDHWNIRTVAKMMRAIGHCHPEYIVKRYNMFIEEMRNNVKSLEETQAALMKMLEEPKPEEVPC